jgi:hypothetical protein
MDILIDPATSPQYLILFEDGTTSSIPAFKMDSLILKPNVDMSERSHLLPPFPRLNSKITFEHEGQYHKGFLTQASNGDYCFSYKSLINKKHPDWSISLPNLTSNWHDLCLQGILVPGHNTTSFVRETTATFVSAANLIWECPRSLLYALDNKHPDRDVWLQSFQEEKDGLLSMDTYNTITLRNIVPTVKRVLPTRFPLCAS